MQPDREASVCYAKRRQRILAGSHLDRFESWQAHRLFQMHLAVGEGGAPKEDRVISS